MAKRILFLFHYHFATVFHQMNLTLDNNQTKSGFNNFPYLGLGVIVGLGFTAVLAEGSLNKDCYEK